MNANRIRIDQTLLNGVDICNEHWQTQILCQQMSSMIIMMMVTVREREGGGVAEMPSQDYRECSSSDVHDFGFATSNGLCLGDHIVGKEVGSNVSLVRFFFFLFSF